MAVTFTTDLPATDSAARARADAFSAPQGWSATRRLVVAGIVWIVAILAAAIAGVLRGLPVEGILPLAAAGVVPGLVTMLLAPATHREWAQISIVILWIAFGIVATLAIGPLPISIVFLCAPAVAALFDRERVVEALVLGAAFAGLVYYADMRGVLPEPPMATDLARWAAQAGVVGSIMFVVTSMFGAASRDVQEKAAPRMTAFSRADLLAGVAGAVIAIDEDDKVDFASREAMDIFGVSSDFGVMPTSALFATDADARGDFMRLIERARGTGHRQIMKLVASSTDGIDHLLEVSATPLTGPGNQGRILVQAQDLTDRAAQMEQRRRERVVADGPTDRALFSAGVAHELRTPLNAIIGFSDMMRSRMFGPLPGRYAEYADLIHDSGQHMLDLIGDVLDLSKVEAGAYQLNTSVFDAGDVVRSSVKMVRPMADTAEVSLVLDVPEDDVLLEADRKAVRQILLNILSNAVKFSPKGGQIDVALQAFDDEVVFSVEDQGPGMTEDEVARIGEPFVQGRSAQLTEARGSGLGLALVASLTELHDGAFEIESDPDEGTLVSVALPRRSL